MPMRRITARERAFAQAVMATISDSANVSNPNARQARAASVAYACPQANRASRQPISVPVKGMYDSTGPSPVRPTNRPDARTSTAHHP